MQYYKEHIIPLETTPYGIFKINIEDGIQYYSINGIIQSFVSPSACSKSSGSASEKALLGPSELDNIINNRAIHNDVVYFDPNTKEVIAIKDISNHKKENISGILYLDSKTKYGSVKDKTIYLFKPTNRIYPNFYVPYKINNDLYKNKKIYVVIQFKEWTVNSKLPHGTVIDLIGIVGDKEAEFEHLRYYYDIKNNNMKIPQTKIKNDENILNNLTHHDYEVFSIDPLGSTDIDDAFHFKNNEDDAFHFKNNEDDAFHFKINEIGIHIASPTHLLKDYLHEILERVSTVYAPHKKYNMLPSIYSDNYSSLLENKRRYALSLILYFDENMNLQNYELKETVVKNIKNFDYDEFDRKFVKNQNLVQFIKFSERFFKIQENTINSHILVEKWMIYTNKKIASILINYEPQLENIILRSHEEKEHIINYENIDDELLKKHLTLRNENSASYKVFRNLHQPTESPTDSARNLELAKDLHPEQALLEVAENKPLTHSKMEYDYYTHFTSPIRRAVDFFIHLLIINKENILEKENLKNYLEKINKFTKNCRKFDRQTKRLDFIFSIKEQEKNIETYGYITEIAKNKVTVYIPEYNLEEKIIIIPRKLESIANIIFNPNEIIYTIDDITITRKLYEKLNLKLYVFTTFENIFDKLKIEIVKT
jgi:exoribonuclease R